MRLKTEPVQANACRVTDNAERPFRKPLMDRAVRVSGMCPLIESGYLDALKFERIPYKACVS